MSDLNSISENLIIAVKKQQSFADIVLQLKKTTFQQLQDEIHNDDFKKAFWINIYNAFFQIIKKKDEQARSKLFTQKTIVFSDIQLSLDDIEHGILRKFKYKFSLGYLTNPFASKIIKILAVSKVDYRIHFALNCGAKSCPPIAFYTASKIEDQLDNSSIGFLESETDIFKDKKEIHISKLFKWYLADFGGYSGIRSILGKIFDIPLKGYKLIFKSYSWEELLDNYNESKFDSSLSS